MVVFCGLIKRMHSWDQLGGRCGCRSVLMERLELLWVYAHLQRHRVFARSLRHCVYGRLLTFELRPGLVVRSALQEDGNVLMLAERLRMWK